MSRMEELERELQSCKLREKALYRARPLQTNHNAIYTGRCPSISYGNVIMLTGRH